MNWCSASISPWKAAPQSKARVEAAGASGLVRSNDASGFKTLMVSDGAPCCGPLSGTCNLLHGACNHSKGIFSVNKRVGQRGVARTHTGGIDSFWSRMRDAFPSSIS